MRTTPSIVFLLALLALPAGATTFTMISDSALADQAALIVQATVLASEPAPIAGPPSTDTFFQVERVVKGYVAGSTIVVRVLGGIGTDGIGLRIWGAPSFRQGERTLLFLEPRGDGTYAILHLMLGAFHERQVGDSRLAVRNLAETAEALSVTGEESLEDDLLDGPRDFEAFVEWLSGRDRGEVRRADYLLRLGDGEMPVSGDPQVLLEDRCTGLNFRWSEFDRAKSVDWKLDLPRERLGASGGFFGEARSAWSRASGSRIQLTATRAATPGAGFASADGVNALLLGDPKDQVAGEFRCSAGGILSVAGVWFDNGRSQECHFVEPGAKGTFRAQLFLEIVEADIVTNDGSACFFISNPSGEAEVLTHELGHTLGLSHSGVVDSVMRGPVHDDGRGAALDPSDRAVLGQLYDISD
jgi:hypothetical protein